MMLFTAAKWLLFYLGRKKRIDAVLAEEYSGTLAQVNLAAFRNAKPLIDEFIAVALPGAEAVKEAVKIAESVRDNANPQTGDEFSPANPNRDAG